MILFLNILYGLDSCVFLKFVPKKLHVTIRINVRTQRARQTAVKESMTLLSLHRILHWLRHVPTFYRAPSSVKVHSCTCNCDVMIGTSTMAILPIFQGRLPMFTEENYFRHQNTVETWWKNVSDSTFSMPRFSLWSWGPLTCTYTHLIKANFDEAVLELFAIISYI